MQSQELASFIPDKLRPVHAFPPSGHSQKSDEQSDQTPAAEPAVKITIADLMVPEPPGALRAFIPLWSLVLSLVRDTITLPFPQ